MKKIKQIKELFEVGKEKQAKDMLGHLLNDSTINALYAQDGYTARCAVGLKTV